MPTVTVASLWPLALLTALPLIWLLTWRNRASVGRARVVSATVLRSVALIAIVVALLKPTLHRDSEDVSVVYVLDVSSSVAPRFLGEALDWIAQVNTRFRPAQSRVVAFADHAELVDSIEAVRTLAVTDGTGPENAINQNASDLEEGLLAALPGFAPGLAKRVVLLSDGNQTEGDAWQAMLRLQAVGARVFAVPAPVAAESDAWIDRITVPSAAHERGAVDVEVRVFSRRSVPARVELAIGERSPAVRSVTLSAGDNRVSFVVRFPQAGAQYVTARVSAEGDQLPRNDTLTEAVRVAPRPHALYVEGGEQGARYLADALTAQGIRVTFATAQDLSDDTRMLNGKDVVILSDVRADNLGKDVVQRLGAFVRDGGGGLIFAAGQNTYGQEGFAKSEVERLLPVTFEAKRKHEDLDLVLLVDRSSSMRGQKIEVSKSAALATLDLLDPEHRLAVVAFDAQPHDVVPLATVGDKREAEDLISRMTSSGQTNIYNALLRAQAMLAASKAKTKHIILLSDGLTSPPPGGSATPFYPTEIEQRLRAVQEAEARQRGGAVDSTRTQQATASPRGFPGIMEEFVESKVTMSTVAIGEKPDVELMANLAKWGGGKSYVTRSDAEVPTLFAAETRRFLNDSIVEGKFRPRVKAWSPTLAGVDFASGPELKGYVTTKPKRFSDVLLEAKKDLPLLAETHYGLGKTVAFLSDVKNRWATDWLDWPGYSTLWAQVVRDTARRDTGEGVRWEVTREGREAFIHLTARSRDGSFLNGLWPEVRIMTPSGQGSVAPLRLIAPGQYRAQIPVAAAGNLPWRFELLPSAGLTAADIARAGGRRLFYSYPDEYRLLPANLPLLRTLSEQTGGVFAPRAEEIFTPRGDGGVETTALWPYCAGAALLLFLLDILVRRAPWPLRRALR
ncbi:MAG TPA: VWA domain-containing protein [Burkholderiales bacterium]|nr:VWA domain-containing protein [Burkholderiales bacterium]